MAAEVPVCDVLCEAMEYLSKLGSNLRTRSENLKEKRITKRKLKNSHAVQKAATKVLLICELSKKSLENVEAGVRKVLSLLEASQAPIGGNISDSNNQKHSYHYFEYRSRKLRIARKINVKHYMSVKVIARDMPVSMQEKYPVYYNCQLKRQRRALANLQKKRMKSVDHSDRNSESEKSLHSDNEQLCNSKASNNIDHSEGQSFDVDQHECSPQPVEKTSDKQQNKQGSENLSSKDTTNLTENRYSDHNVETTSSEKINTLSTDALESNLVKEKCETNSSKSKYNNETHDRKIKSSKLKVADVYSSDSNDVLMEPISNNINLDNELSPTAQNNDDGVNEPQGKKSKVDNSNCQSELDSRSEKFKKVKEISKCSFTNKQDSDNDSTLSKQGSQNESGTETMPLIRCVNLSKLLKPGLSAKNCDEQFQSIKKTKKQDEYWAQKRIEVKEFKPKKFSVRIERLPNLSVQFLLCNNLKKITKGNVVVCQIQDESDTPNTKKVKACKNALLNDSESDESSVRHNAMKVKKALLIDSDSENNISDEETINKQDRSGKGCKGDTDETESQRRHETTSEVKKSTHSGNTHIPNNCQNDNNPEDSGDLGQKHSGNTDKQVNNNQSEENVPDTPIKMNQKVKSSLLNDSANENSEGHRKNDNCEMSSRIESNTESPGTNEKANSQLEKNKAENTININQRVKSSLLNDSSEDEFAGFVKDNKCSEKSIPIKNKVRAEEVEHHVNDENIMPSKKKSLPLNNASDDTSAKINEGEVPTVTNENVKTSLLNDSSDEKSKENQEQIPSEGNENVKSTLLNDSSDVKSEPDDQKERQKTPKSKRKHARKCREAKKKLKYSSSSDSEQEKPKQGHSRKKVHNSSSSSSEDVNKKKKKKKLFKINSDSNDSDKNKTIGQVDGAVDDQSNSSVDKMVRSKAKPSGSSSQNSDNQDASDKDIDGLTNLNNLHKNRRDESTRSRREKRRSNRSKPTPTIGEDLLKSESSSEEVSDAGEEEIAEQDLPAVTLSELNGDHLAKDDLLGDSDSSVSHNENDKDQSEDPDNSEDKDDNVKSKRRKANAISSDSESGARRRKQKGDSDFEDSEEESSESANKAKRKKKANDSDASVDSSDAGKKKRRRIKIVDSEGSGSDTENEGRNKHGRKNIRKVMGKNQLEEATKKAAREEKERIARIAERQKLYNNLEFDESGKPDDEKVLEKVVLDFDPETKEPLIQVDRGLVKKLKPHQANGIKFMWDACFESVKRIKKDKGSGCILAHCMGLGKTLQVISLTHTLLIHGDLTGVRRVLVVCPLSTVLNWVNEIRMWLKHADSDFEVDVYELSRYKQNSERAFQLQQWFDGGGVCVLGYEMFRNLSADNNKKFKKKMLKSFQESLVEPGPDLVVCDEGHLLKNEKTSLSQSMNRVKTLRRIVLTGTPLQNNLKEYYCMVQFVKPNLLGKYNEYLNRFVNPITNGQYTDSTEHDIRVMKRRSHVLHKMLDGAVQRRDYGVLAPFLPPKHEYVLFITLTDVQIKLYEYYLDNYSRRPLAGKSSGFLFPDFQSLQRIWTHPLVLKYNSERYEIMQQKKREREEEDSEGSLVDFIDDDSTPDVSIKSGKTESSTEESTDDSSDMSDDSRKKSKKKKSGKKGKGKDSKPRRGTRANPLEGEEVNQIDDDVMEVKNENPTEWWIKLVEESELDDMRNSHKLVLLFDILRQCEAIGDKLLVFSQSLYSLDLIEHFLGKVDEATQEGRIDEKLGGHVGSWSPGIDYFRLDGSTSCENRSIWCKNFNREDNPRARLFLISTRAGGLGINLVAANRVVIFDVSWNPSHDVQSIFRVYRFGQKKPCYVYRFLAMGTMEEKIYERQVTKQAISKRVIDEQQIDRHYAENDLAELYKFEARPEEPRPLPTLPKDRLFAEMLKEHEAQIYKYHEHDSLLENKEEETLSEEERKAAWEDFENEKTRPPPAPFPSAWSMHNGMMPGLLAQQQQQLAYAALAAMLRKDMPNISDNQIRDMLPMIYNANPALMQKMGEIYKYAQPGMMNPAMMNPVMNAGGAAGGTGGGASGLQYEPPWQRQHQQQQQMRLQQLLQQQQQHNQMGAKFYAGGLGSRDPIAMAMQQQRAREMLMGGGGTGSGGVPTGAGRPRGRPPLQPRHPAATSQDVVTLDSD